MGSKNTKDTRVKDAKGHAVGPVREARVREQRKKANQKSLERLARQQAFLAAYAICGVVSEAADAASTTRATVYRWRDEDDEFAEAFADAHEVYTDSLETVASTRARGGKSDTMTIFMLKANRPTKYSERRFIEGGDKPINVRNVTDLSPEDLAAEIVALEKELAE